MPPLIPGSEPYFHPGDSTGCLVIHGFTASPEEVRPLAEHLASRGYTVLAPRLFAHGTRIEDMSRARYQDWQADVEGGWHLLRGHCKQVVVMGFSMGGVLALWTAAVLPVAAVVSMGAPIYMPDRWPYRLLRYADLLGRLKPYSSKGPPHWLDPSRAEGRVAYPANPVRAAGQLWLLQKEVEAALPEVNVPALLIHSRADQAVPPANMPRIYRQLGTTDKTMVWLQHSGHHVAADGERETVFAHVDAFLGRVLR